MSNKCTEKLSTLVPDYIEDAWKHKARQAGCCPSELLRDLVCVNVLGMTWGEHVKKDRLDALGLQAPEQGVLRACK